MIASKQFFAKVFDADGVTPIATIPFGKPDDGSVHAKGKPSYSWRINQGQGEMVLDLKTAWDDFGEGTTVAPMNVVKVYALVIDAGVQTSTLIYTGFMSRCEPYLDSGGEGVKVTLLGLGSLLTRSYYSDGDFTVVHSAQDPEAIGRAVIDAFNLVYGGSLISYTGASTDPVGTNVSVTFTDQKWADCLKKVGDLSGQGWWWRIGEDGLYYLRAKPTTPTHRLTVGRDIESLSCPKDFEAVINDVYVRRSGGTETHYEDATSQTTYGTGTPPTGKSSLIIADSSLTSSGAADQRGQTQLANFKDAAISARVTVNSVYPIETIRVGDTVSVNNFDNSNTFFGTNNLLVASLSYDGDTVSLELERVASSFGQALAEFVS